MKKSIFRWLLLLACWLCLEWDAAAQQRSEFDAVIAEKRLDKPTHDLSLGSSITLEEPRFAYVNLTGFNTMPAGKSVTCKGWMEVYDGRGNYFKMPVTIAGQGGYTIRLAKKNFVCHFCDEQWNEDNGCSLKIGNWVAQDAFHFKAFYTDFLRGIGEVGYKLFADMVADRKPYWERGGYLHESRARCFPDGFPCAVYLEGAFHGIYAWQLKKHRKNMNQKKAVAEHIHLDGNLQDQYIFRGKISWNQFEVRTPKELYDSSGNPYDGNKPKELIDETKNAYNLAFDSPEVKAAKQRSAAVKAHIVAMSKYWEQLVALETAKTPTTKLKEEIAQRYDIESLIDYYVFHYFTMNGDGSLKNWQWFTYDGKKWLVTPYDLDQTFGLNLYGVVRPADFPFSDLTSGPFYWIHKYYQQEIRQRYMELRYNQTLEEEHINGIANDWQERVGEKFYALEREKWQNSPCYSEAVCNEGWEVCEDWSLYNFVKEYNSSTSYHAGDVCKMEGRLWRATMNVRGIKPFSRNSQIDTIERFHDWVGGRIRFLDTYFDYDPAAYANAIDGVEAADAQHHVVGIYTLSGVEVAAPIMGTVNIFRYSDGRRRKVMVR